MLLLLIDAALACGGFAPTEGSLVSSDTQQALFELGGDAITVTYRAVYAGNAADFAWVIAVPGVISSVAEGDAEQLERLAEVSAPEVVVDPAASESEGGCGCGGTKNDALSGGRGWEGDTGGFGVTVTGSGFAGEFSYTTLAASDAASLTTWLDEHGYDTSYVAGAIEAYVADPLGYEFVAVQLRPDVADTGDGDIRLDPLAITYGAAADGALHARYPAMLARSATVESVRTEIYVLAAGLATLGGGWTGVENPANAEDSGDVVGPDYENADGLYAGHLSSLGGEQRQMWLAWAGDVDGRWLTRWDAQVFPSTNVTDPIFTDSGDEVSADTVIYLQEESAYEAEHPSGALLWLLPVGLVAGVGLRRRR